MSRALSSELLKLRTTKTFVGLVAGTLGFVAFVVVVAATTSSFTAGDAPGEDLVGIATIAQPFALVLGILSVASEYRHGTITSSLLVVPNRVRLLAAKLAVAAVGGAALGLATIALALALATGILGARDVETELAASRVVELLVGTGLAAGLFAALGVAVGAIVPNQVGAIVGAFAWMFVGETLLRLVPGFDEPVQRYGLGGLGSALAGTAGDAPFDPLGQVPAGLLLLAYAAVLAAIGMAVMRRRDVG